MQISLASTRVSRTRLTIAILLTGLLAACSQENAEQISEPVVEANITVFEGARVIIGDGSAPIENATLVVTDDRISAVGPDDAVVVPAGAARVDLAGATVMPMIIDTHTHLSRERDALIGDLRSRARFGVGAALSLGQDTGADVFQVRNEVIPGAARYLTAGRGITAPEPGRSDIPHWVENETQARAAVREE
ncbi:MAG: hypothetical protein WD601_05950, partial [Pseudohongiellaceae bacterium]